MNNWKEIFKRDWKIKIEEAEKEFQQYKLTDKLIYLQQSGNKIFSVVKNYLMYKYNRRVRSYNEIRALVINNSSDSLLLSKASQLHYFFYNADLQMSRYDAVDIYKDVRNNILSRLRGLN